MTKKRRPLACGYQAGGVAYIRIIRLRKRMVEQRPGKEPVQPLQKKGSNDEYIGP